MKKSRSFARTYFFTLIIIFILAIFVYFTANVYVSSKQVGSSTDMKVFDVSADKDLSIEFCGKAFTLSQASIENAKQTADSCYEYSPGVVKMSLSAVSLMKRGYNYLYEMYISEN